MYWRAQEGNATRDSFMDDPHRFTHRTEKRCQPQGTLKSRTSTSSPIPWLGRHTSRFLTAVLS